MKLRHVPLWIYYQRWGGAEIPFAAGAELLPSRDRVCEVGRRETIGHAQARTTQHTTGRFRQKSWRLVDLLSIPACRRPELIMGVSSRSLSFENPPRIGEGRTSLRRGEGSSETSSVYLGRSSAAAIETETLGRPRCAPRWPGSD